MGYDSFFSSTQLIIPLAFTVLAQESNSSGNAIRTDLSECKLTQLGTEYAGLKATTAGGIRCQMWYSEESIHEVDKRIRDRNFPEDAMQLAKNYCRNPTNDPRGPWCYTMSPTIIDDSCDIHLCNSGDCRLSGTGADYGGTRHTSLSGKKCKSWTKSLDLLDGKAEQFSRDRFPDQSRSEAKNYCRNPDDSLGGPWCYVEVPNRDIVEREYCNIPFCDDKDNVAYTRFAPVYSTLTRLKGNVGNMTIWIKLWNPKDQKLGQARLLLGNLQVPASSEVIAEDWQAGVEIILSNYGSGQAYPKTNGESDFELSPKTLLASRWTGLWITWGDGFISVGYLGKLKPIFLSEYGRNNSISGSSPEGFSSYGIMGTGVLWSTSLPDEVCAHHTTFGTEFLRSWPLKEATDSYDFWFHLRASHEAMIQLLVSPAVLFPSFTVVIGQDNSTLLIYQAEDKSGKQILHEISNSLIPNFWTWQKFTISIFGTRVRMLWHRDYGEEEIFSIHHPRSDTIRWFSIGSEATIAQWALFCDETDGEIETAAFPTCKSSPTDIDYEGTQWTSENELPCVPWVSKEVPDEYKRDDQFVEGSALKALNKCRNPSKDSEGPFCFAFSRVGNNSVEKRYCPIRKCKSSECRLSGTANDYTGTLSATRSGRTCARWVSNEEIIDAKRISRKSSINEALAALKMKRESTETANFPKVLHVRRSVEKITRRFELNDATNAKAKPSESFGSLIPELARESSESVSNEKRSPINFVASSSDKRRISRSVHRVNPRYLNDTLYPELSAVDASNYCRNPSRSVVGTWCYTTDPEVPRDLCNVRDCELPEECIYIIRGDNAPRRIYVLPEYRTVGLHFSVKIWEPDHPDSLTFVITGEDELYSSLILKIGANDNEKVILYRKTGTEDVTLIKEKTLPHLLYLGRWTAFVLRMARGGIKLYYEGATNPLFEWDDPDPEKVFLPIYYYFNTDNQRAIGLAFKSPSKCHVEVTKSDAYYDQIVPISIWDEEETPSPNKLQLMLRGQGQIGIPLYSLPSAYRFNEIIIYEPDQYIAFVSHEPPEIKFLHERSLSSPVLTAYSWTNITIEFYNYTINVYLNGTEVFHYVHTSPLLFYFFTAAVESGSWVTWAANCIPTDIDGAPRDGGWSEWGPWSCSASCGGGTGVRRRVCNNPEPNIRGQPCLGPSTSSGRCNANKCNEISDGTVQLIKQRIRRHHTSIVAKEGSRVTLWADADVVSSVKNETPTSKITWSRNGMYLRNERNRVRPTDSGVEILLASVFDSGVYAQTVQRSDDSYLIFKIITLAVVPLGREIVVRKTLPFSVVCHCVVLGYVYSDLRVSWYLNGKLFKDFGISTPSAVNYDHVPRASEAHRGEWRCVVEQTDLDFRWTTNVVTVEVLGAPNWRSHLMEDELTRPIFGWMPNETFVAVSVFAMITLIVIIIVVCTIFCLRFRSKMSRVHRNGLETSSSRGLGDRSKHLDSQHRKLISEDENDSEDENVIDKIDAR